MPTDSGAPVTGRSDNDDEIIDEAPGQLADDDDDDPITLSGQTRPSSVGLSFMATEWSDIEVEIEAGQYQPAEDGNWQRKQVRQPCTVPVRADQASSGPYVHRVSVLDGSASVDVRWRAYGNGTIVTVALVNRQPQQDPGASPPRNACSRSSSDAGRRPEPLLATRRKPHLYDRSGSRGTKSFCTGAYRFMPSVTARPRPGCRPQIHHDAFKPHSFPFM